MPGTLNGNYRILDLSERSPAAAIAGMVLADLGAEVIRVEPQGGDPVRVLDGTNIWFRGQKSVTIGAEQVRNGQWQALRDSADVIVTTAQPWTMKPADLLEGYPNNPKQILVVLTAHPRSIADVQGPLHGTSEAVCGEVIEALYGCNNAQAGWREGPVYLGWPHAFYGAAWLLQLAITGALLERERTGKGQIATTSLFDGFAMLAGSRMTVGPNVAASQYGSNSVAKTFSKVVVALFECADENWVQIHTAPRGAFNRMCKLVGREDLIDENAGADAFNQAITAEVAAGLIAHLEKTFKTKPAWEWTKAFHDADVCCMPALKAGEVFWLDQTVANGLVDILPDGERRFGTVAKFSRTPLAIGREVPAPGQHNSTLLTTQTGAKRNGAANANGVTPKSPYPAGAKRVGPLDGILVLDFGAWMAGPYANRIFADLGARVIKIEEMNGDPMRGPTFTILLSTHRGKESIAADLKKEASREVIYELVKRADVVHHNMRAGAMVRLGMGYEKLSEINPNIIYCHSSGYGNEGPWSHLATFEPLHSALCGMLTRTGGEFNAPRVYLSHMDYGCALTSATMCVSALLERERSGKGQYIEVPQIGAGMLAMSDVHGHQDDVKQTFPLDYEQRGHAPTNALYRTSDDWIMIGCYSEQEWEGVRRGLGVDAERWTTFAAARNEPLTGSTVGGAIDDALATVTSAEAARRLRAAGVACAIPRPFSTEEAAQDPALRALNVMVEEENYGVGRFFEFGHTIRFGNANSIHLRSLPDIGEHTVKILRELGISDSRIDELLTEKAFRAKGWEPSASAARTAK